MTRWEDQDASAVIDGTVDAAPLLDAMRDALAKLLRAPFEVRVDDDGVEWTCPLGELSGSIWAACTMDGRDTDEWAVGIMGFESTSRFPDMVTTVDAATAGAAVKAAVDLVLGAHPTVRTARLIDVHDVELWLGTLRNALRQDQSAS